MVCALVPYDAFEILVHACVVDLLEEVYPYSLFNKVFLKIFIGLFSLGPLYLSASYIYKPVGLFVDPACAVSAAVDVGGVEVCRHGTVLIEGVAPAHDESVKVGVVGAV